MKRCAIITIIAMAMSWPAIADEQRSEPSSGSPRQSYAPSLAVVMELTQLSHFKLWLAGNVRNWALADYELEQMNTTLQDARRLFPSIPKADTSTMIQPAQEIRNAIQAKDGAKFDRAFEKFTSACDSCHEAAGLGFIDIRVPRTSPIMTSPLSNQAFAPR